MPKPGFLIADVAIFIFGVLGVHVSESGLELAISVFFVALGLSLLAWDSTREVSR